MSEEKKNDVLVTLLKKAVGLPTGNSGCCGAVPVVAVQPEPAQPDIQEEEAASSCCSSVPYTGSSSSEGSESGGCCG